MQQRQNEDGLPKSLTASSIFLEEMKEFVFLDSPDASGGRIVTVYLCGTGSNRDDHKNYDVYFEGENVSHTFSITQGEEYIDKIIVDGPGSGEHDINDLWVDYNGNQPYSEIKGQSMAYGLDERIQHILAVLKNKPTKTTPLSETAQKAHALLKDQRPISQVNIAGWSRGAAAGITLSSCMARDPELQHIPVNMILIDPVPGFGLSDPDNRALSDNVKKCVAIYCEDERSFGFNPVVPDAKEEVFYMITLPGGHAQVAGSEKDHAVHLVEGAELRDVGRISRHMMENVLLHFGTKLDTSQMQKETLTDLLVMYDRIRENREGYKIAAQRVPYTTNQLTGEDRKVIEGNSLLNQFFSSAKDRKKFSTDKNIYIDYTHEKLTLVVDKAQQLILGFNAFLYKMLVEKQGELIANNEINLEQFIVSDRYAGIFEELVNNPLFCRAVSEELQKEFRPEDLNDLSKRAHSREEICEYMHKIIDEKIEEHNQKIQHINKQISKIVQAKNVRLIEADHVIKNLKRENKILKKELDAVVCDRNELGRKHEAAMIDYNIILNENEKLQDELMTTEKEFSPLQKENSDLQKRIEQIKQIEQAEENMHQDRMKACLTSHLAAINVYLAKRATETRTGLGRFFGYSAKDYYDRRDSWLEILDYIKNDNYDQIMMKLDLEITRLTHRSHRSNRYASLLRQLKYLFENLGELANEEFKEYLPLEKIEHDMEVFDLQKKHTAIARIPHSIFGNTVKGVNTDTAEEGNAAKYKRLVAKKVRDDEFLEIPKLGTVK